MTTTDETGTERGTGERGIEEQGKGQSDVWTAQSKDMGLCGIESNRRAQLESDSYGDEGVHSAHRVTEATRATMTTAP